MGDDRPFKHKHVTGETDPNKIKAVVERQRQETIDRMREN